MGCQWAILEEAHITILAVHPHCQGQGLGQALLISLLMAAYDRGLERATLEVRASNKPALSLYQKFGFKTAGRRRRYYKDTGEDALILWCGDLQQPESQKTLAMWHSSVCDRLVLAGWDLQMNLKPLLPYT
jgi:ribosomal-protein-alanine N-acetyltransferase